MLSLQNGGRLVGAPIVANAGRIATELHSFCTASDESLKQERTMVRDPNDVVRLVRAPNPAQAHIWKQALRDQGIQAKVVGDYLGAGLGNLPQMQAEVWVHRDDVSQAEEVLRRVPEARPDEEEEP
jgi:hypothetical protein